MAAIRPDATISGGTDRVVLLPTIKDPKKPTITELNGAQDISLILTADGFQPSVEEGTVTDRRLGDLNSGELPGRTTASITLIYVWTAEAEADLTETLVRGSKWVLVSRSGPDIEKAFDATDKVNVYEVTAGVIKDVPPEDDAVVRKTQDLKVSGAFEPGVKVTADGA